MKLLRYGPPGEERPAILDSEGAIRDLGGIVPDIGPAELSPAGLDRLRAVDPTSLPKIADAARIGPPVSKIGKVICIGLNYSDHAAEVGMKAPAEPIIFLKATTSVAGPNDPIIVPQGSKKLDWEVELCVVIGTRAQYVEEADAMSYVAGYCLGNDLSERAYQLESTGQWTKGKSFDGFAPLGPWLVTPDEVPDPQRLGMWLDVNGERMQTGSSATMIFNVVQIVSYLSRYMTLMPGDVIMTGTPPGVGSGKKPPRYLSAGDTVVLGIEGLGTATATVVPWERSNGA